PAPTSTEGTPARGEVVRARFMGKESLVEFGLAGGALVTATVPAVFLPKPGTVMWLSIRRDRCFVFPTGAGR
ncbi:MAG: TOBE domain-containing protein, partial [Pseudomonadota bacterium]